jgi:hypothetical protein
MEFDNFDLIHCLILTISILITWLNIGDVTTGHHKHLVAAQTASLSTSRLSELPPSSCCPMRPPHRSGA